MKIKGSVKALTVNALLPIFIISTLSTVIVRSMQVYNLIDATTGFYKQSSLVNVVFNVLVFGVAIVFVLYSFLSNQSTKMEVVGVKSKPLAAVTYAYAVLMVFDTVKNLLTSISAFSSFDEFMVEGGNSFKILMSKCKILMSNGTIPLLVQSIFGLLACIYFFCLAFSFKNGDQKAGKRKLMALAPVGWVAFRMVYLFVSKISFIRVSDLLMELIMFAFMAIFFMALAQVASGVYSDGSAWKIAGFGLSASLIAAALEISRLIFTLVDREKYINPNHPFNIVDLMFCIFVPVLVFTICKHVKADAEPEPENPNKREPGTDVI